MGAVGPCVVDFWVEVRSILVRVVSTTTIPATIAACLLIVVGGAVMSIVVAVVTGVVVPAATSSARGIVSSGYHMAHADGAPRKPREVFLFDDLLGCWDSIAASSMFLVAGVTLGLFLVLLGLLSC